MPIGLVHEYLSFVIEKKSFVVCSDKISHLFLLAGHKHSLDVATILQGKIRYYSVLMLAWGIK